MVMSRCFCSRRHFRVARLPYMERADALCLRNLERCMRKLVTFLEMTIGAALTVAVAVYMAQGAVQIATLAS